MIKCLYILYFIIMVVINKIKIEKGEFWCANLEQYYENLWMVYLSASRFSCGCFLKYFLFINVLK